MFPRTKGGGRGDKRGDLYRVGAGDSSAYTTTDTNTSFATSSITKLTIAEIWGQQLVEPSNKFDFFSCKIHWL